MDWGKFALLVIVVTALAVLGSAGMFRVMKKAGIKPTGSFTKYIYDNVSGERDSRTGNHRRWFYSKKGGKRQLEITQTRGGLTMEFYTEDGVILQQWHSGDPQSFTVEIPPGKKVYYRTQMTHFSGSICFR